MGRDSNAVSKNLGISNKNLNAFQSNDGINFTTSHSMPGTVGSACEVDCA